jgi:predicted permease
MFFLFAFLFLGYLLTKIGYLPRGTEKALSRLENALFVPALMLHTFATSFTADNLRTAWKLFLLSFAIILVAFPLGLLLSRLCSRDGYLKKIYAYGLTFANFGFMGTAVVQAVFPDLFLSYLIYIMPLYITIYSIGVPLLLMPSDGERSVKGTLKNFLNPMFVCMLIGAVIGLVGIPVHPQILSTVKAAGDCMSPVAMILTGVTIAECDLFKVLKQKGIYIATALRLVAIPTVLIAVLFVAKTVFSLEGSAFFATAATCAVAAAGMPLGLNTVVIPGAYGKDTSVAAGMALISHLCSALTIPILFSVMSWVLL